MENNELGIYIHIPFCKQKCYYCDFVSFSDKQNLVTQYIEAVKKEIKYYLNNQDFLNKYNVTTIYIGGGTPSYIESKYILEILEILRSYLKYNQTKFEDIEITIEINPGTVNLEKMQQYKKAKINRLSIGLQSANNEILKKIGRIHSFEEFLNTYNIAKAVGFDNINVDLMIGLPEQRIEDVKNSINEILKLEPTHISVYSLIVEEGTIIDKLLRKNVLKETDEDLERNMYWYTKNTLELNGYNHYEISNFAKKGKESKHNVNCWLQKEYIGIGLAAHSYLKGIRYNNCSHLQKYIDNAEKMEKSEINEFIENILQKVNEPLKEKNIFEIEEVQNLEDKKKEYMLLGLRKIDGVQISKFKEKYLDNPIYLYRNQLEKLVNEKLILIDGDFIKLTNKGLDLANLVWEEFV